jgi:hypothetical protein
MWKLSALVIAFLACPAFCLAQSTVDVTGSTVGIADTAPPFWPHGSSIETYGVNSLYPNGGQFGLSTTAGGFGAPGEGRTSSVGLSQSGVSFLVKEELEKGNSAVIRQTSAFRSESAFSSSLFSSILAGRFRLEMSRAMDQDVWRTSAGGVIPASVPSPSSILQDQPQSTENVLNTGL